MDKLSKERLLKVAELLENLPREKKFSLRTWATGTECGSTACAIGWAAQDPWFRRRGLSLRGVECGSSEPKYRRFHRYGAVMRFFRITKADALYLFDSLYYDMGTRRAVASRIRQFVAEQEKRNG